MWVVYSLLILVGILVMAALFLPVYGRVTYDGTLQAKVWVLGVPISLLPGEKKAAKPGKGKQKKSALPPKTSRLEELKELLKQDDLEGTLAFLQRMAGLVTTAMGRVCRAITVGKLRLELCVATGDPADTAVRYGQVCGVVYPALAALGQAIRIRKRQIRIEPNFLLERSDVRFDVRLRLSAVRLLGAAIPLLFGIVTETTSEKETDLKEDI